MKDCHKESGAKWRKTDLDKCRRLAFRRELEVTKVILNARDKAKIPEDYLGGVKVKHDKGSTTSKHVEGRSQKSSRIKEISSALKPKNNTQIDSSHSYSQNNHAKNKIVNITNNVMSPAVNSCEHPSSLQGSLCVPPSGSNIMKRRSSLTSQDEKSPQLSMDKEPTIEKAPIHEEERDMLSNENIVHGTDLCMDAIAGEVTSLEIARLRKNWSNTLSPSPLCRGAPRTSFVDEASHASKQQTSRYGLLTSPQGRKFILRGAAAAAAVSISAEEVAQITKKERSELGHDDLEGFQVAGFGHSSHDTAEGIRRAVLRSATSVNIAATEEALSAAAADEPLSKYALAGGLGSIQGSGQAIGLGNGLKLGIDPAELVPYPIAASAIKLDNSSQSFKKRLSMAEQFAIEIDEKRKVAKEAEKHAAKSPVVRRNSGSLINDPLSPLSPNAPAFSSTGGSRGSKSNGTPSVGKVSLSRMFKQLKTDQSEAVDGISLNSQGNNSHSVQSTSVKKNTKADSSANKKSTYGVASSMPNKATKSRSRFDLNHFVDSYGAYAVSVQMRGGGPGYHGKTKTGVSSVKSSSNHSSDRDNISAAASLIQRSYRLRAHRRYLWACAFFRVPLHVAFLFHHASLPISDDPTDFFNDPKRLHFGSKLKKNDQWNTSNTTANLNELDDLNRKPAGPSLNSGDMRGSAHGSRNSAMPPTHKPLSANRRASVIRGNADEKPNSWVEVCREVLAYNELLTKTHLKTNSNNHLNENPNGSSCSDNDNVNNNSKTSKKLHKESFVKQKKESMEQQRKTLVVGDEVLDKDSFVAANIYLDDEKKKVTSKQNLVKSRYQQAYNNEQAKMIHTSLVPKEGFSCAHVGERWHSHHAVKSPVWPDRLVSMVFVEQLLKDFKFLSSEQEASGLAQLQTEFRKYRAMHPVELTEFQKQSKLKFKAGMHATRLTKPRLLRPTILLAPSECQTNDTAQDNQCDVETRLVNGISDSPVLNKTCSKTEENGEKVSGGSQKKKWFLELIKPQKVKQVGIADENSIIFEDSLSKASTNSLILQTTPSTTNPTVYVTSISQKEDIDKPVFQDEDDEVGTGLVVLDNKMDRRQSIVNRDMAAKALTENSFNVSKQKHGVFKDMPKDRQDSLLHKEQINNVAIIPKEIESNVEKSSDIFLSSSGIKKVDITPHKPNDAQYPTSNTFRNENTAADRGVSGESLLSKSSHRSGGLNSVETPKSQYLQAALLGRRNNTKLSYYKSKVNIALSDKKVGFKNKTNATRFSSLVSSVMHHQKSSNKSIAVDKQTRENVLVSIDENNDSALKPFANVPGAIISTNFQSTANIDDFQRTVPSMLIPNTMLASWKQRNKSKIQPAELTYKSSSISNCHQDKLCERKMVVARSASSSMGIPWLLNENNREQGASLVNKTAEGMRSSIHRNRSLNSPDSQPLLSGASSHNVFINSCPMTFDLFYSWWLVQLRLSESSSHQKLALYKAAFMLWTQECEIAHVTPQCVLLPQHQANIAISKASHKTLLSNTKKMAESFKKAAAISTPQNVSDGTALYSRTNSGGASVTALSDLGTVALEEQRDNEKDVRSGEVTAGHLLTKRNSLRVSALTVAGKFKKKITRRNSLH